MMQELIGMKIGPYQIQRHLARGGMANVYLACNVETDAEPVVAIKLVHTSVGNYCERFRRETKEHSTLHHDHILPVLAYGESASWCYLVTPYVAGGTLTCRLDQGPLSVEDATEIFSQLAGALDYSHEQGIVHRDIKSSNVLMRDEHYAYLADFGLVKHVGLDASLTASGYMMGTPEYMAPELAEEEASPQSDVYALGILLYQMLTGQVPFKGNSPFTIYLKHLHEQPVAPAALNPTIPPEIGQVVLRALAKNPDDRYQTAQDFNTAYQQALVQANVRQSERTEAAIHLYHTTLPVPLVRLVKQGDLHEPDELQRQEVTLPRRRKQQRGFATLVAVLILLMLSLLSPSGKDAQQLLLTGLAIQPITQTTHHKEDPTSHLPPAPTMLPTPQSVIIPQHAGERTSNNGSNGQSYGHGGNGPDHHGHGDGNSGDSSGHGHGDE